jgi:predicted secreted hydrolase
VIARRQLLALPWMAALGPAQALTRRPLVFPRDHGSHPDTRTEWWYLTGWLQAADDARVDAPPLAGFQLTFFRSRTGLAEGHPSAFAAQQLLFAHAALTPLPGQPLRHDQRMARAGLGLAEASTTDTDLVIDQGPRAWTLRRTQESGRSVYQARWQTTEFALDLTARATQPVLLQGDAGWSRKGPGPTQASHYVTEPQLAVQGQLQRPTGRQAVRGHAWLDHEWSDDLLAPGVQGWDWIGINLFDGSTLTAFQLRDAQGRATWAGGSHRTASTHHTFTPPQVRFEATGERWTSPTTGATYPTGWRLTTPAGSWRVRPLANAQEMDTRRSTGSAYWEGLSDLLDEQGRVIGRGYLEMTGYAGALQLSR